MNTQRDHLDEAIDHVATRLTHVDEDAQFASRVIAALPERVTWFGWLTHAWAPRLAMLAIVAGGFAIWNARHTTAVTPSAQPLASVVNTNWPPLAVSIHSEGVVSVANTMPVAGVAATATVDRADHEFSLPPVSAPATVEIAALSPAALPAEGTLTLAPIVIADLPLTAESFPQRH